MPCHAHPAVTCVCPQHRAQMSHPWWPSQSCPSPAVQSCCQDGTFQDGGDVSWPSLLRRWRWPGCPAGSAPSCPVPRAPLLLQELGQGLSHPLPFLWDLAVISLGICATSAASGAVVLQSGCFYFSLGVLFNFSLVFLSVISGLLGGVQGLRVLVVL